MSYNLDSYHTTATGSYTSAIAEVAAQTPTVLKYSSGARFEYYSSVHTWTVTGLKTASEGTTCIESTPLTHQNSSKWCMVLTKKTNELHLCFSLKKSGTDKRLRAKLRADEVLPTGEIREVFPSEWYYLKEGEKSGTQVCRKVDAAGENNSEDGIVLRCEVRMHCVVRDELSADVAEPQAGVITAVSDLLNNEVLTDFELRTGGVVLKAHRAILSVRSPYFAAMLRPHTKEAKEGCVDAEDVKPEVLKQVLAFVYTGVAPALKEMPWELLVAADKYQLHQLKRQCEAHLASCLSVDNAAGTAANASLFFCDLLWDRAVSFIRHNLCEVMRSRGWAETIVARPEAVQRICELME